MGAVTGIGAAFAAMNTMYALVASRTRELGTLRALCFSQGAVLMAFVLERLILALAGGVLGRLLSLLMNSVSDSVSGTLGEVSVAFQVTPAVRGYGLLLSAAMGLLGSLLPATHAARLGHVRAAPGVSAATLCMRCTTGRDGRFNQ